MRFYSVSISNGDTAFGRYGASCKKSWHLLLLLVKTVGYIRVQASLYEKPALHAIPYHIN